MHGLDPRRFAEVSHPDLVLVVITGAAVVALCFWLTVRRVRRVDVV